MGKVKGLMILEEGARHKIYGPDEVAEIERYVDFYAPAQTAESIRENLGLLSEAEVIFSGWGAPVLDEAFLSAAKKLKAVFYGAGSIRSFTTEAFWRRGITISSAWAANAVPVAEYTLSQILFGLKCGWQHVWAIKEHHRGGYHRLAAAGAYGSCVGIISLGMIGRRVCELLKAFDVTVLAYDPYVQAEQAAALGVELVGLDAVFERADVVSLHTPNLPETQGMIRGTHFAAMKAHSTFINSARGAVVNEDEMIAVLEARQDIAAVLDVTDPEPPAEGSRLYSLANVVLTPHIAGSMERECRRHAKYMLDDLRRYLAGQPLRWSISREQAQVLA